MPNLFNPLLKKEFQEKGLPRKPSAEESKPVIVIQGVFAQNTPKHLTQKSVAEIWSDSFPKNQDNSL